MTMVRKCNCDYEVCKTARNVRNAHVGEECVHYFGRSHKIVNQVVYNRTNLNMLESWRINQ